MGNDPFKSLYNDQAIPSVTITSNTVLDNSGLSTFYVVSPATTDNIRITLPEFDQVKDRFVWFKVYKSVGNGNVILDTQGGDLIDGAYSNIVLEEDEDLICLYFTDDGKCAVVNVYSAGVITGSTSSGTSGSISTSGSPASSGGSSSGFTPIDISNLEFWFDAQEESYDENDSVPTLHDQNTGPRDMSQVETYARGVYKKNVIDSDKHVLRLDGDDYYLHDVDVLGGNYNYNTIVIVFKLPTGFSLGDDISMWVRNKATAPNNRMVAGLNSDGKAIYNSNPSHQGTLEGDEIVNDDDPHIMMIVNDVDQTKIFIDGVGSGQTYNAYTGETPSQDGLGLPVTDWDGFTGDIAEVIIYSRALTDAQRLNVETYLSDKYNISVTHTTSESSSSAGSSSAAGSISDSYSSGEEFIQKAYVFGGSNTVELGDNDEYYPDTWTSKTNIPSPNRERLVSGSVDNKAYIFGGRKVTHLQDTDEYFLNSWSNKTGLPSPARESSAFSTIDDAGYLIGGSDGGNLNDNDQYDPDLWTAKTNLVSPSRRSLKSTVIDDKIYVFGGHSGSYLDDTDEYDPDTWTSKSNMPSPNRSEGTVFTISNKGYYINGFSGSGPFNDTDEYDPDTWTARANTPSPSKRGNESQSINNKGYSFAGFLNYLTTYQDTDEYDPDTWTSKSDIPSPGRYYAGSTVLEISTFEYGNYWGYGDFPVMDDYVDGDTPIISSAVGSISSYSGSISSSTSI